MAKYVYVYTGGSMAQTPEEQAEVMAAWGAWFGELGSAIVDMGAPFGASTVVGDGPATATGYSIVTADTLDDAATLAKGCPILSNGGAVAVHETIEM